MPAEDSRGKRSGAGDGARTRDIQLGRLALYQLSYSRPGVAMIRGAAGDIGAGHTVTALYEVKFRDAQAMTAPAFATLRIRYKDPSTTLESGTSQKVEKAHTKDWILASYLNQVYFGNHAYGVEAAAQTYFDKHAADLSLVQASLIAGIREQ